MTIEEFLTARLDEEAAGWSGQAWQEREGVTKPLFHFGRSLAGFLLADVEAKRSIIKYMKTRRERQQFTTSDLNVLCMLASPYCDHSDWREDWVVLT